MTVRGRQVRTGYKPTPAEEAAQRDAAKKRSEAIQRFVARYDALVVLEQQASDWAEGFGAGGGGAPGSAGGPVDTRIVNAATQGMLDHKTDAVTGEELTTHVPFREGHGLADKCAAQAALLRAWFRAGDDSDDATFGLLPPESQLVEMRLRHQQARQTGAGICARCKRDVPGIVENAAFGVTADRLKKGLCFGQPPHCYAAWQRAGFPDRGQFIAAYDNNAGTIPGTPETAGASPSPPDALQLLASGEEVRPPTAGPYCEHVPPHLTDPDSFRCPTCGPAAAGAA